MDGSDKVWGKLATLGFERGAVPFESETVRVDRDRCETTATVPAMGTRVVVAALDRSAGRVEDGTGLALEAMERLVGILNRHDEGSALSYLNATGYLRNPPVELAHVIQAADHFHRLTHGRFDVTVAPLVDLFRTKLGVPPAPGELAEARALVGHAYLKVARSFVRLDRAGMRITLDGIAKGFVVDAMADVLRGHGIHDYLINAGGEIRTAGHNPEGRAWRIGVRDPAGPGTVGEWIGLTDGAVATSGGYEHFFGPSREFHHIVDAGRGVSPARCASVSVLGPTTMAADALATGAFIMDPASAVAFIDRLPGWACFIIDSNGTALASRRWRWEWE